MAVKLPELRGRPPVQIHLPLMPRVAFTSDGPLLILPAGTGTDRYMLFRRKDGGLERVGPVARVATQGALPFGALYDVELYPLEGTAEDLVLVHAAAIPLPSGHRYWYVFAYTSGHLSKEALQREVEWELPREDVLHFEVEGLATGLTGDPRTSLCLSLGEGGCALQFAPVAVPGWVTIFDATRTTDPIVFARSGGRWERVAPRSNLAAMHAAYVPEDSEYVAVLPLELLLEESAAASTPALSLEEAEWPCECAYKLIPVAWRLRGARLPEEVERALLEEHKCGACVGNVGRIIEATGPEWPPTPLTSAGR